MGGEPGTVNMERNEEGDANGTRARRDGKWTETVRGRERTGTGSDGNGMGTGRERDVNGT